MSQTAHQLTQPLAVPTHVAIIMDGNRRWARARGLPGIAGHQRGADAARRAVDACGELGISYLTLYAFSSENWRRPADEVGELMNLLRFYLRREVRTLKKNGVRVQFLGERDGLAEDILELMENAESATAGNSRLVLTICLNYGGRQHIAATARELAKAVQRGELDPERIDEKVFDDALNTMQMPAPDLLIRTSGEQRLSNFLLWEMAYAEFVFLPIHWPDFGKEQMREAVDEYGRRERRYGASSA
ncbi:MAG: polyprenyl diphosphate synthase [Geminicoccaceae bacterium]